MPVFLGVFFSLIFYSGFYFLGKIFVNFFKIKQIIRLVSDEGYQYGIIGISFFVFLIYPIFFLEIFTRSFFFYSSILVLFLGLYQIVSNFNFILLDLKKNIYLFKQSKIFQKLFYLFFLLYFLVSLCPPSSGDSVAYHLSVSKYILENGFIPKNYFDFEAKLFGSGEFFNSFPLSIKAYQFTSFLQFIGLLSIFGVLKKNCLENNLNDKEKYTLYIILFSCPMFIFLIATSKPQFFYISLCIFSLMYLFKITNNLSRDKIFKIFILSNILLLTSVSAKINFSLSLLIFNFLILFFLYKKKILIKSFVYLILLFSFSLLPPVIWKSEFFNFSFYNFLLNPLPINLPGYYDYYLFLKNYDSDFFPFLIFFPNSLGTFTNTLGLSTLAIFFLFSVKFKGKIKYLSIVLIFSLFMIVFGQKSPRFFLEIFILSILLLPLILKKIYKKNFFKIFKIFIFAQSFAVALSLLWAFLYIFPANISKNLNHKILSKYADGYSLYSWVNSVLPKNQRIIVDHRSTFFLNTINYLNTSALTSVNYDDFKARKFYLEDIKRLKPNYILFRGSDLKLSYGKFDFEQCLGDLYAKYYNVANVVSRNPFNIKPNQSYHAYIYKLNYKKIPNCVKKSKIK